MASDIPPDIQAAADKFATALKQRLHASDADVQAAKNSYIANMMAARNSGLSGTIAAKNEFIANTTSKRTPEPQPTTSPPANIFDEMKEQRTQNILNEVLEESVIPEKFASIQHADREKLEAMVNDNERYKGLTTEQRMIVFLSLCKKGDKEACNVYSDAAVNLTKLYYDEDNMPAGEVLQKLHIDPAKLKKYIG